jgi:hypothetical protein
MKVSRFAGFSVQHFNGLFNERGIDVVFFYSYFQGVLPLLLEHGDLILWPALY